MMEAVHRYEGTTHRVMGDGIMALFGAPVAHEDHGVRACYAALRMQETVKRERFGLHGLASVLSCDWLVRSLAELGAFDEGMAYADEAVRTAEEVDHSFTLICAYHSAGLLCLRKGELPKALSLLERSLALVQSRNVPYLFGMTAACLSSAYALSGQVGQALPLLDQVMKRFESGVHWLWVAELSETYLLTGHIDRILPLVGRALERSPDLKERGHQAWLLRLLAEIAALRDPPEAEQAKRQYRDALALATQLGMRPLVAHCNLGLCKLYRQKGKREQAHEPLTTATTMYREMNMQFWLQKAEAEMRQLG